jgi:hypothetical protein
MSDGVARRSALSPEEAKQRIRECQRRYREAHREEIREKQKEARLADPEAYRDRRRAAYHRSMDALVKAGFEKLPPGRKRLYTPEQAVQVAKAQRFQSYLRRQERIGAAKAACCAEAAR